MVRLPVSRRSLPVLRDPYLADGDRRVLHARSSIPWFLASAVCILVFAADLIGVKTGATASGDRWTELTIHHAFGHGTYPVFQAVSAFGSGMIRTALIVLSVVALLAGRRLIWAALLVVATGGAALLWPVAKTLVARPRPHLFAGAQSIGGYSFPSGHATDIVAFFGALAFILWIAIPRRNLRLLIPAVSGITVVMVGLSRIVLGVHYPTDVIGGYALGGAWLAAIIGTSIVAAGAQSRRLR
jgi:membrane-associated phospholipid phosphatase